VNPKYDPKITKTKGLIAGGSAAAISALTSVISIVVKYTWPAISSNDQAVLASASALLICMIAGAWWAMYWNKRKHA
jgi:uncharacterized membrane protein (DUF4010 family)